MKSAFKKIVDFMVEKAKKRAIRALLEIRDRITQADNDSAFQDGPNASFHWHCGDENRAEIDKIVVSLQQKNSYMDTIIRAALSLR